MNFYIVFNPVAKDDFLYRDWEKESPFSIPEIVWYEIPRIL